MSPMSSHQKTTVLVSMITSTLVVLLMQALSDSPAKEVKSTQQQFNSPADSLAAASSASSGHFTDTFVSYLARERDCVIVMNGKKITHMCDIMHHYITPNWEKEHLTAIDNLPSEATCLVTFGEWFGPIALYWIQTKNNRNVVAFEPDPMAYARLGNNLGQFGITPLNMCVNHDGSDMNIEVIGGSSSRVSSADAPTDPNAKVASMRVKCISYHKLKAMYPDCFYKIDVEGFEAKLIDDLLIAPPKYLSLSVHTPYMGEAADAFLKKLESLRSLYKDTTDLLDNLDPKLKHKYYEVFMTGLRSIS